MWIVPKWHIPPCIKGVLIYNTLGRSWENWKKKNNYHKNELKLPYIIPEFLRIFSKRILEPSPKGSYVSCIIIYV